jgi:ATP-dependent Clp protease ATP-binding subunit ClpC
LDAASHEFLIEKGYDPTYGARPMRRAVERYLEDPMAEEILRGSFKAGDQVEVTREGDKLSFKVAGPSGATPPAPAKTRKSKG